MSHIVLTDEQARIVAAAAEGVEVRDSQGQPLAFFRPFPKEEAALLAEARRRLQTPGVTVPSSRVRDMLAQLQWLHEKGEATQDKINAVVANTVSGGPQSTPWLAHADFTIR